jgi:predicted RNA-binding protein with PUA-like domain
MAALEDILKARPTRWLLKSEPDTYAFAELVRDGRTVWDGVRNAQAAIYLRAMRAGDEALFYHSGEARAVVGLAEITREAFPDASDPAGRFVAVEISPLNLLPRPVTLAEIKADPALADMVLLRQSRLSVSPVTEAEWAAILARGGMSAGRA